MQHAQPIAPPAVGETVSPARCLCGEVLPAPRPTVTARIVCSPRCQRHRDHVLRRVALRRQWIVDWLAACDTYTPEQIAAETEALQGDIDELLAMLAPSGAIRKDDHL